MLYRIAKIPKQGSQLPDNHLRDIPAADYLDPFRSLAFSIISPPDLGPTLFMNMEDAGLGLIDHPETLLHEELDPLDILKPW